MPGNVEQSYPWGHCLVASHSTPCKKVEESTTGFSCKMFTFLQVPCTHFVSKFAAMPVQKSGHCTSMLTKALFPVKQSPVSMCVPQAQSLSFSQAVSASSSPSVMPTHWLWTHLHCVMEGKPQTMESSSGGLGSKALFTHAG